MAKVKRAKLKSKLEVVSLLTGDLETERFIQLVQSCCKRIQLRLPFAFIFPPANYCYHAVGCVPEWTGIYTFYQTVEQVPR